MPLNLCICPHINAVVEKRKCSTAFILSYFNVHDDVILYFIKNVQKLEWPYCQTCWMVCLFTSGVSESALFARLSSFAVLIKGPERIRGRLREASRALLTAMED